MSDLHRALGDISDIRRQVASSTQFRGFGPATLAATGLMAAGGALVQTMLVPDPTHASRLYLGIWVATAAICAAVTGCSVYARTRRMHSGMSDEMISQAVEQFLPALGAGMLLTTVLWLAVPRALWMLPGLWQIMYSLGIFASCRFLPRTMPLAGAWFLLTGLTCIGTGDARALAPWAMGVPFAAGQILIAAVLLSANLWEERDEA